MTKGLSFDELYPGTYIKAGEFKGKAVTLTVTAIKREMLSNGTGGEEGAVTVSFAETEKQFVMNKTNAVCLRAMWGDDSGEWAGHKVTLHPVKDESGLSESGLCIRVKGSPELDKPLKFRARLGRKMVTQNLVPTGNGKTPPPTDDEDDDSTPFDDLDEDAPGTATEAAGDDSTASAADGGLEDESDVDGEIPGRGALFDSDDPARPATSGDKKALSAAVAHVDAAEVKKYRQGHDGRGNSELTHGECVEFTAWAVERALS